MHPRLVRPRFLLPARRRWPRWAWALAGAATVLAVVGLAASVAASVAQGELRARLDRLEEATGRRFVVGRVEVSLVAGLTLRDVRVTRPDGRSPQLAIAEVRTDLTPLAVLAGRRRPERVSLVGLEAAVAARPDGSHDLDDLVLAVRGEGGDERPAAAARPLEVALEGGAVDLHLSGLRDVALPRLRLRSLSGTLARDAKRVVTGRATATVDAGEGPVEASMVLDAAAASAAIAFVDPLSVAVRRGDRTMTARLRRLARDGASGETVLEGLALSLDGFDVAAEAVALEEEEAPGALLPVPSRLRAARARATSARSGAHTVSIGEIELTLAPADEGPLRIRPSRLVARDVTASPGAGQARARVRAIAVDFVPAPWAPLVAGEPLDAVRAITVAGPELTLAMRDRAALEGLPGHRFLATLLEASPAPALAGTAGAPLPALPVREGFEDGLLARLGELAVEVRDGRLLLVDDGEDGKGVFGLDQLGVTVARRADGTRVLASDALIVRESGATGAFELSVSLSRDGGLERVQGHVTGKDFAHIVSRFSDHLVIEPDAEVDVKFDYQPPAGPGLPHHASGTAKVRDFGFQAWRISHAPVRGLEGEATFTLSLEPEQHRLRLELDPIRIGQARLTAGLTLVRPPGAGLRFDARVAMPRQRCDRVAEAIPEVLVPRLAGWKLRGEMAFDARLTVDLDRPNELELKVDGDVDACEVVSLGREIDLAALKRRSFVHHPIEPTRGRLEHITVGPGTREWVASHLLPDFVKAAAIVTEDRNFLNHKGVRWELVARALKLDLEKERFVYGGSTITQQLVKNLYLTREKTLARKLEELIISWQLERVLTKDEILTMYINVIEYGPDLYGIKRASRHYFGKLPWELSPLEAAFIMGLKPYPHAGYKQWEAQTLNHWWIKRVSHVLDMMHRREKAITETELLAAAPYQPRFRRPDEPLWLGRSYVRPTEPPPGAERPTPAEGDLEARLPAGP